MHGGTRIVHYRNDHIYLPVLRLPHTRFTHPLIYSLNSGYRSGLQYCESSLYSGLVSLPNTPSADFSIAVRIDCSILSQNSVARDFSKGTMETSQGKTQNFPRVNAGFIKHTPFADGGLHGHVPIRPGCTTPQIRFLYVVPRFRIGLPPDPASRRRPCPSASLRLRDYLA
jgi:hypothetical protein